jgi:thioredoxin 1
MMNKSFLLAALAVMLVATSEAFSTAFVGRQQLQNRLVSASRTSSPLQMAVVDIASESSFDEKIKSAGKSLVVIDYSTTWCGPCKVIAPKFEEFSEKYPDAVFLKVIGDASPEASKLMKREGVRSVPSFHYFMDGEKVDVVNGANAEAIEAAITKHVSATA